jgi:antirestriction protein ArdC
MDVYQIITDKIVNLLEGGIVPWRRPWTSTGMPRNLVSKKPYRGVNVFLLSASKYVSPFWLTMRQANELGGQIRKGEESTAVVFWKIDDVKRGTEDLEVEETDPKTRRRFLTQTLPGLEPRTMRTAEIGSRQPSEDRDARARSDRSRGPDRCRHAEHSHDRARRIEGFL